MTTAEYYRLYKKAKASFPRLTLETMTKLRRVYEKAAALAAKAAREATLSGKAAITSASWTSIEEQLRAGAAMIRDAISKAVPKTARAGIMELAGIGEEYIFDAATKAGADLTRIGIHNMYVGVADDIVASIASRIYSDGYLFSDRVWRAAGTYQSQIKDVISTGLAQGRDLIDIADDIGVYVKSGKQKLIQRYGDLLRGTSEFAKRIRKNVYYPAMRLVRSELYMSIQNMGIREGQINPGANGLYDWVRNTSEDWGCECPRYAEGSPYTIDTVPSYPHACCLCQINPRMRPEKEFVGDLQRWGRGESVDYIDKWYVEYYS